MEGQRFIDRVNFQTNKHHRQNLRQQINPQLIQRLQISQNPSMNYMNAYKNVYRQELQKTLEEYKGRKTKDQYLSEEEKYAYVTGLQGKNNSSMIGHHQQHLPLQDHSNYSTTSPKNITSRIPQQTINGRRFVDYDEERTNKFQTHIKQNYDGGQAFFKVQDAYLQKKQNETKNYADILRQQLMMKQYLKMSQKQKILMENMAVEDLTRKQKELDYQKYMMEMQNKGTLKQNMSKQVNEERIRKQRRSKQFHYNNVGLHNPILNPIQYHIDNPYILKKIQDQSNQQHYYDE